jgi:hypothetical protein
MGSLSTQIVFVPAAKRDGVFVGRRIRKVACATAGPPHDSSSRRFLHKRSRHQQLPFKGFPACHEGESEAHRNHLERQKARAFDFSCGDEEPSTSPNHDAMDNINNHSDEYWSARILTEVHAFSFTGFNTINCCCMSWYYPNWIRCILECFQPSLRLWEIPTMYAISSVDSTLINPCCMSRYYSICIPCVLECFQPSLRLWRILKRGMYFLEWIQHHKNCCYIGWYHSVWIPCI